MARTPGRASTASVAVGLVSAGLLALTALAARSGVGALAGLRPAPDVTAPPQPFPSLSFPPGPSGQPEPGDQSNLFVIPSWVWDMLGALIGLAVVALVIWFAYRVAVAVQVRRRERAAAASDNLLDIPDISAQDVHESLQASLADLRSGTDVNDAILACWRRLAELSAESGVERRPSQTATEFTVAILASTPVAPNDLTTLATLYRRAMFSGLASTDAQREQAVTCLERLSESLTEAAHG